MALFRSSLSTPSLLAERVHDELFETVFPLFDCVRLGGIGNGEVLYGRYG
jgi:hypothetical protein